MSRKYIPESKDKDCSVSDRSGNACTVCANESARVFVLLLFSYVIKSSGGGNSDCGGDATWPRSWHVGRLRSATRARPLAVRSGNAPINVFFL